MLPQAKGLMLEQPPFAKRETCTYQENKTVKQKTVKTKTVKQKTVKVKKDKQPREINRKK